MWIPDSPLRAVTTSPSLRGGVCEVSFRFRVFCSDFGRGAEIFAHRTQRTPPGDCFLLFLPNDRSGARISILIRSGAAVSFRIGAAPACDFIF